MEQTTPTPTKTTPEEKEGFWKEFFKFLFISLAIALPFRLFIAQPFIVSGASMDPTFADKQYLIVDQITYRLSEPKRGDVVIFKFPLDTSKYFIKRIIGLPGERVTVHSGKVTIRNEEYPEGFTLDEPYVTYTSEKEADTTLQKGEYFVMGDNREKSLDSRYWGPMPKEDLMGRALVRLFPPQKTSLFPGEHIFDK